MQAGDIVIDKPGLHEKSRLNAGHFTSGTQHALRQLAHKAALGAAVDEAVAFAANPCPQFTDGFCQRRIGAWVGAQIYSDGEARVLVQSLNHLFHRVIDLPALFRHRDKHD